MPARSDLLLAAPRPTPPRPPLRPFSLLAAMQGKRIAVIGDVILDAFLWGDATRISPEAPVAVVLFERSTYSPGGAANVAANIAGLGGRPLLFSVVGADPAGRKLRAMAAPAGIEIGLLAEDASRPTTLKQRVLAGNKHLLRVDRERNEPIADHIRLALLRALRACAPRLDGVALSDYAKGCVDPRLAAGVARICREFDLPWCVDPKLVRVRYPGASIVKPNVAELIALTSMPASTMDQVRRAAHVALRRQRCRYLLVTRGRHGMALFGADGAEFVLESGGRSVADVTGAGDTVSATIALALAAGIPVRDAVVLANQAAAYVVSQPGTAVVRARNLLASADRARLARIRRPRPGSPSATPVRRAARGPAPINRVRPA